MQNKQKHRRTTDQKKEKRRVKKYTTNKTKVQHDRMTDQTLRHRSTKVKNKRYDTETQEYKIDKNKGEQEEKTNKKTTI